MRAGAIVPTGVYPTDWRAIAQRVKDESNWRCIRCQAPHDRESGHVLTVHHLNGDKSDCGWANILALCQRCHLSIQGRVNPDRPWVMAEHTPWFRVYVAAFYAKKYLGEVLTRAEVEARLDELLALEVAAVLGIAPSAADGASS